MNARENQKPVAVLDVTHLKQYLEKGELMEIAAEYELSYYQARAVMEGRKKHFDFLSKVLDRVERNKAIYDKAQGI